MYPAIQDIVWKLRTSNVAWPRRTEAGVLQQRRQLALGLEAECDGLSAAMYQDFFLNAPQSVAGPLVAVGTTATDATGVKLPAWRLRYTGTWQVENIDVDFDAGAARLRMTIWQYTSAWTPVPTAD